MAQILRLKVNRYHCDSGKPKKIIVPSKLTVIPNNYLFDLPTHHFESDLNSIKEVSYPNKTVEPKKLP